MLEVTELGEKILQKVQEIVLHMITKLTINIFSNYMNNTFATMKNDLTRLMHKSNILKDESFYNLR